jgi:hypothetical protein
MDILADNQLRDWLLHRLNPEQAAIVEEHAMGDDVIVDRLLDLRADLFDDYARGRLDAETRRIFQSHWLASPADGDRLTLAIALAKLRAFKKRPPSRAWAIGALAASVMLAAGLAFYRHSENTLPSSTSSVSLPTISLRASIQRGAEAVEVELPAGDALRLQTEIEHPNANSRYALRVMNGDVQVFQADDLSAHQAGTIDFIEATLPTSAMGPGTRRIVVIDQATSANVQTWTLRTHNSD